MDETSKMAENQRMPGLMIPSSYFNGFRIIKTATDLQLVLFLNGSPQEMLIASPITIKNLAKNLNQVVSEYEKQTGVTIPEFHEMSTKLTNKK